MSPEAPNPSGASDSALPPDASPAERERAREVARRRDALLAEARGERDRDEDAGSAARLGGLGVQFAVALVLFLFLGSWLDKRYQSGPWGTLLGLLAGFGAGTFLLLHALRDETRREAERRARKANKDA